MQSQFSGQSQKAAACLHLLCEVRTLLRASYDPKILQLTQKKCSGAGFSFISTRKSKHITQLCKLQKPSLSATTPTTLQGARSRHLHGTAPARPEILGIVHEKSTILSVLRPRCGFSQPTGAPKKKRWVLLEEVPFHRQVGPHLCDVAYLCLFQDQPRYLANGPKM